MAAVAARHDAVMADDAGSGRTDDGRIGGIQPDSLAGRGIDGVDVRACVDGVDAVAVGREIIADAVAGCVGPDDFAGGWREGVKTAVFGVCVVADADDEQAFHELQIAHGDVCGQLRKPAKAVAVL